jgi:hypothetical protein
VSRKVSRRKARVEELAEELTIGAALRLKCESRDIHAVVRAVVDYLVQEYPAQDLYIPAGIAPSAYPIAAIRAALSAGQPRRAICKRFQLSPKTLYRILAEAESSKATGS